MGYSGGKFDPKENDLIRGIVAAKSLHAFVAICISPVGESLKVENIKTEENIKKTIHRIISDLVILRKPNIRFIILEVSIY